MASNSLLAWYKDFSIARFNNFNELKEVYSNASILHNNRIIFNIKGNSFRLIISMDFTRQAAYVIWFGTHQEYDKIDAATVAYVEES
ncbi:MAG TPA: type II toxin-antitoxin system HigB family toxin [Mucilaginibacter sp.]|nr:type II toxin-antitoxin system HigB family toxin [Mucilaginibacter sp.]